MDSKSIKNILYELGADICGIASVDRFTQAPEGFRPTDTFPSCKSVIIFGKRFLKGTMDCKNTVSYTVVRNMISNVLDIMSVKFCDLMEKENIGAVPIGAIGPSIIDQKAMRSRGIVSLKHAAVLAGLGYIGKNTLLITPDYGNMVWLTGVMTDMELESDSIIHDKCPDDCNLCITNCPVEALKKDNPEMDQGKCWNYAFDKNFYFTNIKCYNCRAVCPKRYGEKNR